ncbi:unnamed protein product [Closterium sp. NIES-64]|nr:unnamed protein product [Closterium sp. NIES-64]
MPQTSPLQVTLSGAGNPLRCREEAPGGGLLRREAAGGAAASLPQPVAPPPPFPCAGFQVAVVGAEGGSTPLGRDGMGEYRDWVVWNKDEGGSTGAGRESGVHPLTHLLLSPFSLPSQQHPAWTTEESLPLLIPPSLHFPATSASWRSARLSRGVVGGICAARHSVLK